MPKLSESRSSQLLYASVVLIPLILLIVLAGFARNTVETMEGTRQLVDRTFVLKRDLALLLRIAVDAETGQRGFVLTQRDEFLEPYTYAVQNIPLVGHRIDGMIIDPTAKELFRKVQAGIETRMKYTDENIELQRRGEHEKAVALVSTGKGKMLMDQVRALFEAFEARLDLLMTLRQEQHRHSVRLNEQATWLLIGLDLLFVGLVAWLVNHLRRAQALLRVCAWSQTVEYEGEWLTYEEYLLRRFGVRATHGISPAEAQKFFPTSRKTANAH